jgi:hypothetical protein
MWVDGNGSDLRRADSRSVFDGLAMFAHPTEGLVRLPKIDGVASISHNRNGRVAVCLHHEGHLIDFSETDETSFRAVLAQIVLVAG